MTKMNHPVAVVAVKQNFEGIVRPNRTIQKRLIPFLYEAPYIDPRLRRPPLPRGDYRGGKNNVQLHKKLVLLQKTFV
jgi:hypothetical protein